MHWKGKEIPSSAKRKLLEAKSGLWSSRMVVANTDVAATYCRGRVESLARQIDEMK